MALDAQVSHSASLKYLFIALSIWQATGTMIRWWQDVYGSLVVKCNGNAVKLWPFDEFMHVPLALPLQKITWCQLGRRIVLLSAG